MHVNLHCVHNSSNKQIQILYICGIIVMCRPYDACGCGPFTVDEF